MAFQISPLYIFCTIGSMFRLKEQILHSFIPNTIYQFTRLHCNLRDLGETHRNPTLRTSEHKGLSGRMERPISRPFYSSMRSHSESLTRLFSRSSFNFFFLNLNKTLIFVYQNHYILNNFPQNEIITHSSTLFSLSNKHSSAQTYYPLYNLFEARRNYTSFILFWHSFTLICSSSSHFTPFNQIIPPLISSSHFLSSLGFTFATLNYISTLIFYFTLIKGIHECCSWIPHHKTYFMSFSPLQNNKKYEIL